MKVELVRYQDQKSDDAGKIPIRYDLEFASTYPKTVVLTRVVLRDSGDKLELVAFRAP